MTLTVGDDSEKVMTTARTVQQLLNEEDIKLGEHDKI
ncbi:ubiquitin-like domain-containing protein, partial [Staphylococcus epidermidis]